MELAEAGLSVEFVNFVKELAILLNSMIFEADSVVILHFIPNWSTRFDVYTKNQLSDIREHAQFE